jgi:hypothetical protein
MPTDTVLFLAGVVVVFAVFAVTLALVSHRTG